MTGQWVHSSAEQGGNAGSDMHGWVCSGGPLGPCKKGKSLWSVVVVSSHLNEALCAKQQLSKKTGVSGSAAIHIVDAYMYAGICWTPGNQ